MGEPGKIIRSDYATVPEPDSNVDEDEQVDQGHVLWPVRDDFHHVQ